jgi:hypothetical protein
VDGVLGCSRRFVTCFGHHSQSNEVGFTLVSIDVWDEEYGEGSYLHVRGHGNWEVRGGGC